MFNTFALAGLSYEVSEASREGTRAKHKAMQVQARMRVLEENLAKALMISEALWEFIKVKHQLTDDELNEKLYQIDMRDGQLDGKNQRQVSECPNCHRKVSGRHSSCIYCGQIVDESVFRMT